LAILTLRFVPFKLLHKLYVTSLRQSRTITQLIILPGKRDQCKKMSSIVLNGYIYTRMHVLFLSHTYSLPMRYVNNARVSMQIRLHRSGDRNPTRGQARVRRRYASRAKILLEIAYAFSARVQRARGNACVTLVYDIFLSFFLQCATRAHNDIISFPRESTRDHARSSSRMDHCVSPTKNVSRRGLRNARARARSGAQ